MQDSLWQAVLGEIELSISRASFVTWFKNTRMLRRNDELMVIGVPNVFIKQQLERKYNQLVLDVLKKNGVESIRVEYKINSAITPQKKVEDEPVLVDSAPSAKQKRRQQTTTLTHTYRQGINERYTFENFIVGSANELAYAACQAIAQNPGTKYNPLFVYGGVGIGKTHLVQAVGNAVVKNNPGARVVYVSTEQFVQEFLDAIRYKKNTDFAGLLPECRCTDHR